MIRHMNEEGQVTIFTVLSMVCLLGFVALATDVGLLLRDKRIIQTAADAAALAGAGEIKSAVSDGTTVTAAAQAVAKLNGFDYQAAGVTVTVHNPVSLTGDPYNANSAYVEVIIQKNEPTFFMSMFTGSTTPVSARAVAGLGAINTGCVFTLDPSASPGLEVKGSADLEVPSCGVVVDSTDSGDALDIHDNGTTMNAASVSVVGGVGGNGPVPPGTVTGVAPASDPLSFIPNPSTSPCTPASTLTGTVAAGCYSGSVTLKDVTLTGTYVFTGNVSLSGNITSAGAGSTIILTAGGLSETSGTVLALTAPASGTYAGIGLMMDSGNTSTMAFAKGDATGTITGIIYAPSAVMTMQDHGGSGKKGGLVLNTDLIVGSLIDNSALLTINGYSNSNPTTTQLKIPALVE